MSAWGQSRHFDSAPRTSALPNQRTSQDGLVSEIARASNSPARRRHVVGIARALDDGQQSRRFQGQRISLAVRGACKNVRGDLSFHRRRALCLGQHKRGIVKHRPHQLDQFRLKDCSLWVHGSLLSKPPPAPFTVSPIFLDEQLQIGLGGIFLILRFLAAMRWRRLRGRSGAGGKARGRRCAARLAAA
jgi:hypothetical protein